MTTWKLTGKPSGGGQCEHCPRGLVHRYEVTNTETGAKMIVGRGCLEGGYRLDPHRRAGRA